MVQLKGYRELTSDEIAAANIIKDKAEEVGSLVKWLRQANPQADPRWLSIGTTHLQEGFMALTRAITRPETF